MVSNFFYLDKKGVSRKSEGQPGFYEPMSFGPLIASILITFLPPFAKAGFSVMSDREAGFVLGV